MKGAGAAAAAERCPECSEPLQFLLADPCGGEYWRCQRSGHHWVRFQGSWWRDFEWKRYAAVRAAQNAPRRSQGALRRSFLRRPDWHRGGRMK